jgi:hypothetical protein
MLLTCSIAMCIMVLQVGCSHGLRLAREHEVGDGAIRARVVVSIRSPGGGLE